MEIHQMRYMCAVAETGSFIAAAARERVETRLILVRPDQYIAWSGDFVPNNVHGLLYAVTGREV
jgi:hypothetical protein